MKKTLFAASLIILTAISCKKDDDPAPTPTATVYMSTTAGNRWNYQVTENNGGITTPYSVTSTSRDTTLAGRQYHVYDVSTGGYEFYAVSGSNYYTYFTFPAPINAQAEYLYLKADAGVGNTWVAATIPVNVGGFPIVLTVTNTLSEKGLSRTVNGIAYTNVIHVSSAVTAPGIPVTSNIHYYYAPKYGQIESSVEISSTMAPGSVDTDTKLLSTNF